MASLTGPNCPETVRTTGTTAAEVLPVGLPKIPARGRRTVRSSALLGSKFGTTINAETAVKTAVSNGEGGIRTLGGLAPTLVFETSTIGHSVTSPGELGCSILDP